jgi:hypothetical protein
MTGLQILDLPADRMKGEAVAVFFFEDDRPLSGPAGLVDWRLNGLLTRLLLEGRAIGRPGEKILVRGNGKLDAPWVLFVGGGDSRVGSGGFSDETIRELLESCRLAGFAQVSICLPRPKESKVKDLEQRFGRLLGEMGENTFKCLLSLRDDENL